jgi:hypothetical protein
MLIGVGEGAQSQERMALERPGRSRGRIWLFGINECPVLLNDPRKSSITEAGGFVGLGHSILTVVPGYGEEGSLGLGSGLPTVEDRHLVDEMIERSSEIVCAVAGNDPELERWFLQDSEVPVQPENPIRPELRARILEGLIELVLVEGSDLFAERLSMFEGAVKLRLHTV